MPRRHTAHCPSRKTPRMQQLEDGRNRPRLRLDRSMSTHGERQWAVAMRQRSATLATFGPARERDAKTADSGNTALLRSKAGQ